MDSEIFLLGYEYNEDAYFDWDIFDVDKPPGYYPIYLTLYLRRGKKTWTIETPTTTVGFDPTVLCRKMTDTLETVTITFTETGTRSIYLTPVSKRDCRLIKAKKREKRSLQRSKIWLPLIPESSIECIEWYFFRLMLGRWNGREVCVWQVQNKKGPDKLEAIMRGLWLARDADVFFTPLGHLTQDDDIIGFVFEPIHGRMVEYRDRALVYEAFYRLKQLNVAISPLGFPEHENDSFGFEEQIMIADGKVRFVTDMLGFLVPWHPTPEEIEEGSLLNKMLLENTFRALSSLGANPITPVHLSSYTLIHLAQTPSLGVISAIFFSYPPVSFRLAAADDDLQLPSRKRNRRSISPRNANDDERRQRQKGRQSRLLIASERDTSDTQRMRSYRRSTTSRPVTIANSGYNDEPYRDIVGAMHSQTTSTTTRRSNKASIKLLLANDDYDDDFARFSGESSSRFQELEMHA
ncbi:hypothetical protein WG66_003298 [Moniliophthora roreri]|nr:hypothetical protein WG66_003298 [Moniliophthora roreri]